LSSGIDFDIKERVKQATDIVVLIGSYLQLTRRGAMFVATCPWHDDKRPSFQINPARQTWTCWVCGIRGDVFSFVMRRENLEFLDALKLLADRAGIPFTTGGKKIVKGSPDDKQILYKAMAWAQNLFHDCLLHDDEADIVRSYLASRNLSSDSIARFGLGFCPLDSNWLHDRSRTTHFSPEILEACDLLVKREQGYGYYERFRGRLMFPIKDTLDRTIAFGGRVVPGVFPQGQEPPAKYVNSRETKLFSKSDNLYGLNLAADETSRTRHLTVVEGYTDVIAVHQAGVQGVVAALGTAINERHIRLLKRYADRVTLLLDGDTAGKKRANEVLDFFIAESLDLRILTLSEGQDPCDFVQQHSGAELQKLIDAAPDALEHKIRNETSGIDLSRDTHAANRALENILQTLAVAPSSLANTSADVSLRFEQLLARLAREFSVERENLKKRLAALRSKNQTFESPGHEAPEARRRPPLDLAEKELIELLLINHDLVDEVIETVETHEFSPGPLKQIYQCICDSHHDSLDVSFEGLLLILEDSTLKDLVIQLDEQANAKQSQSGFDLRWQLDVVLGEFEKRRKSAGHRQLIGRLEQKQMDAREEEIALTELLEIMRQRKSISAPTEG
jgi:DNA primase